MRESMTSMAGATASVARRTSSVVTPGPRSGARRMKAISASTRGAISADASTLLPFGTSQPSRIGP